MTPSMYLKGMERIKHSMDGFNFMVYSKRKSLSNTITIKHRHIYSCRRNARCWQHYDDNHHVVLRLSAHLSQDFSLYDVDIIVHSFAKLFHQRPHHQQYAMQSFCI